MLKNILAITGKPGLYRLVSRGTNMLIVESLLDGKRMPTYARDKIVSLADVSMYTTGEDIALREVLEKLRDHENAAPCSLDAKKATNDELRGFFAQILPEFDRDRVYPTDIKKLILWYNVLVAAGITDFSEEEQEPGTEMPNGVAEDKKAEPVHAQNTQVKTQKTNIAKPKTGVGTKKG